MGNAEKALAFSLLLHAALAVAIAAFFEFPIGLSSSPALDVTSVELSLSDDDLPHAQVSPPSQMPRAESEITSPLPDPPALRPAAEAPETVPLHGTVKIPLLDEPAVEMRLEKPVETEAAETPVSAADQARIEACAHPKKTIKPRYPRGARLRGEEGIVKLKVKVDAFGIVTEVSVALSSGFSELDSAAVKAVQAAIFNPASIDGGPVESSVGMTFVFKLRSVNFQP